MKNIYAILIAILYCLICSCYTKNQAIDKFCSKDTASVMVTIHDTIITPINKIDTFFSNTIDTFYFEKDNFKNGKKVGKLKLSYSNNKGKINLKADCETDTVYYEKKVLIEVPIDCPKLVWYKQLGADYWYILPLIILILFIIGYIRKILNNG